jgi:hypothetical protein
MIRINIPKYSKPDTSANAPKMWSKSGLAQNKEQQEEANPIQQNIRNGTPEKNLAIPGFLKKGGMIKKTGMAKVHKGEVVMPKTLAGRINNLMQKHGK